MFLNNFIIILFKIIFISIFLNNINSKNITLKEAKIKSPIPFVESFCNFERFYLFSNGDPCNAPFDKGNKCREYELEKENKNGTKWYYDDELAMCLNFGYKGCGGNGNRFDNDNECYHECYPLDAVNPHIICSLGKKEKLTGCKQEYPYEIDNCPSGYKCVGMLEMSPLCCNITNYEIYERNVSPKCDNGKKPLEYLGKSCEDEFCPLETKCIQLELFAHCCPK